MLYVTGITADMTRDGYCDGYHCLGQWYGLGFLVGDSLSMIVGYFSNIMSEKKTELC